MSSQEENDLELIKQTLGGDFDYRPADETLSDAKLKDFSVDVRTPSLSALKAQRLGWQTANGPNPVAQTDANSRDNLFERFTSDAQEDLSSSPPAANEPRNRVYIKTPKTQSDLTEAFAPKPIVVSGTTGKVTERG
jgi:hypothetical protein